MSTTSGSLRAPQLLDVVLDPGITGVGTDGVALYGDEAVEKGRRIQTRGPAAGKRELVLLSSQSLT